LFKQFHYFSTSIVLFHFIS